MRNDRIACKRVQNLTLPKNALGNGHLHHVYGLVVRVLACVRLCQICHVHPRVCCDVRDALVFLLVLVQDLVPVQL